MISGRNRRIINAIKKKPVSNETLSDLFDMARVVYNEDSAELHYCLKITEYVKEVVHYLPKSNSLNALYSLQKEAFPITRLNIIRPAIDTWIGLASMMLLLSS